MILAGDGRGDSSASPGKLAYAAPSGLKKHSVKGAPAIDGQGDPGHE